ncbi:MAG: hypothetical protein IKZ76_01330 [Lachnospiraceae bacterium]|nr:hypothetical protein [Lachnospiraceae bacterium]MBR5916702.1 hypothetical protein [Lachnospiraceae bacterium]MBR6383009.1 hypothetical protein [Lachnospiraceae bacterium]
MDNFTDKLAQKLSAQEMIKANAQAEANEMRRLQEQVAQYEAILQDMRKLNYKNSELTDKINALVDESINKVQTSHAEGEEGENAEVSKQLSEEIITAIDEALSNFDSNFGSALNESVNNTLLVPVGEMKQEVSGSVADIKQIAEDFKGSADDIRYASDLVRSSADDLKNSADAMNSSIEGIISSSEEIKNTTAELKNSNDELKTSVKTSVDNALLAIRRENREIADHLEYIRSGIETINRPSEEEEMLKREEEERKLFEEQQKEEARLIKEEEDKRALQEMFKQSDDFVHKENVKVYRNVQAVVVDEFKNQTEGLTKHNRELYAKLKSTKIAVTIAIILGALNLVLSALAVFNIFK